MRILQSLFFSLIVLFIVGVVGFFIVRELWLIWGVSRVRTSLSQMRQISSNAGLYLQKCKEKGLSDLNQDIIDRIQLRFESSTEFVVEVVCAQFPLSPVLVTTGELPPFVTKLPGSSGIIWGVERSGLALQVWGRSRAIVVEEETVDYEGVASREPIVYGAAPVAQCAGYGFTCCALDSSIGQGSQLTGAIDCPRSCYQSCQARPVVLSLTTQPFYDVQTRSVAIGTGESVEFNYVVETPGSTLQQVLIDFGDGFQQAVETPTGSIHHTYSCVSARCEFVATVTVTDVKGNASPMTPLTQVTVVVGQTASGL